MFFIWNSDIYHYKFQKNMFYIKSIKDKTYQIHNFSEFESHVEQANFIFKQASELISFIKSHIGPHQANSLLEMFWSIKNYIKITVNLYTRSLVQINFMNTYFELSYTEFKEFLLKYKQDILNHQQEEKLLIKPVRNIIKQTFMSDTLIDCTKKVGNNRPGHKFFYYQSLPKRFLAQACRSLDDFL